MDINAFIKTIESEKWNIHGVEVYIDGGLEYAYKDTQEKPYSIYSATKTIAAIGIGMVCDEGRLDLDKSVLEYLPENVVRVLSGAQQEIYKQVTARHLLTMSIGGFPFRPEGETWLRNALEYPVFVDEGGIHYSNVSAYLMGVVGTQALGEDFFHYLNRKLFIPLSIDNPEHGRCPDGYFYGGSHMKLRVNELSRIGMLLYNKGVYQGERLLSESFVNEATCFKHFGISKAYGYFLWKYLSGYCIKGKWGQKCIILPEDKLMITYLASMEENAGDFEKNVEKNLLT